MNQNGLKEQSVISTHERLEFRYQNQRSPARGPSYCITRLFPPDRVSLRPGSFAEGLDGDLKTALWGAKEGIYHLVFFDGDYEFRNLFFASGTAKDWQKKLAMFLKSPSPFWAFGSKNPELRGRKEGEIILLYRKSGRATIIGKEILEEGEEAGLVNRQERGEHLAALFGKVSIPDKSGDFFAELRAINHAYRLELAKHVAKSLNAFLERQHPSTYEDQKALALKVNTLLRDFGLAISYNGQACLLRATEKQGRPCFRLQAQDSKQTRLVSSVDLSSLMPFSLIEEAPRTVSGQGYVRRN